MEGCCPIWGLLSDICGLSDVVEVAARYGGCCPMWRRLFFAIPVIAAALKCSRLTHISLKPPTVFTKIYSHNSHISHISHTSHNHPQKNKKPDQSVGLLCLKVYSGRAICLDELQCSFLNEYHCTQHKLLFHALHLCRSL